MKSQLKGHGGVVCNTLFQLGIPSPMAPHLRLSQKTYSMTRLVYGCTPSDPEGMSPKEGRFDSVAGAYTQEIYSMTRNRRHK